jgi:hypothetical protein
LGASDRIDDKGGKFDINSFTKSKIERGFSCGPLPFEAVRRGHHLFFYSKKNRLRDRDEAN